MSNRNYNGHNYIDDLAFLINTLAQAKSLLLGPEQPAGGIGFHVKAYKTRAHLF